MNRTLIFHILLVVSAAFLVCGCAAPEEPDVSDTAIPLSVSVNTCSGSSVSRSVVSTTGTGTGEVGSIGVFLTMEDGYSPYADVSVSSAIFTLDAISNAWDASRDVNLQKRTARLYAWYPVKSGEEGKPVVGGSTRTVSITVSASQTFDGANDYGCSQTDYLYGSAGTKAGDATAITVNRDNNNPTINLQHALAQVVFAIEYKASRLPDAEYDFVKSISLQGPFRAGAGTMQLNDGTLSLPSQDATLVFKAGSSPQLPGSVDNPVSVAYGLVAPKAATTGIVTVHLVLGQQADDANDRTLSATTTLFDAAWQKGVRYTYHLLLDKNDLTFKNVEIKGWTDEDKGNTGVPPVLE